LAGVAMIYQELSLAPHLSVRDNIWLGMEPPRRERDRRAREALAQLGHADLPLDIRVGRLSVAHQQIVEIARAVATGCQALVLDEPTSSLAKEDVARLFELIRRLNAQGHAVIYISHFLDEVKQIADRFTVLRDGQVAGSGRVADTSIAEIITMMVGRKVDELYPRSSRQRGAVALEVRDLAGLSRPSGVDLTLYRGEVLGIAGLIGSGRTELVRAIFGLDKVRGGEISVGLAGPSRRWAGGFGMVSEDRKSEGLAIGLSITDNLTMARTPLWVCPAQQWMDAQHWVERFSIRCRSPQQRIQELSGGNQQKVALARLMHARADVWLLDEPTRGVDVGSKAEIYRLIDELAVTGKAVLMVSSYLPELLGVCDRIAVMCRGRLGAARPVSDWNEESLITEATGATL
jgi:ribose transport system ATP-binding protein